MAYFEIIEVGHPELRKCLDALRVICNPREKQSAHVTVAGPFRNTPEPHGLRDQVIGATITVYGVGCFFGERQNTVILECDAPIIKKVWRKYAYGYTPHITLYDGESQQLAEALYTRAREFDLHFEFPAGRLVRIESTKGQQDFTLASSIEYDFVAHLVGMSIDMQSLDELSTAQRLNFATRVLRFISANFRLGEVAGQR